jgi:transposase
MHSFQYHLGIDLHRKTSYWTLIDGERKVLYKKNLPTTKEGIEQGIKEMEIAPALVEAAIEPVSQWGWYGDCLAEKGMTVRLVDVYKTKLIAGTKLKNDKVDALALAELLRSDFLPTAYRAPEKTRDMREFMRHRAFLARLRARIRGRVHQILWKHGIISPWSDLFGIKAQQWLRKLTLRSPYKEEREELTAMWRDISERLALHNRTCEEMGTRNLQAGLLMSIPGIGIITSLTILAEVGDFSRFSSPDKLACYAGLVSSSYSSGERTRLGHITHRGSVWLRTALVEATATVNPRWGVLHDFYQRISEKKGSKVARVALARKMLTLSWHLIKTDQFYKTSVGRSDSVKR